jgi:uncharacterized protein YbaA (DUF1428 family)
LLSARNCSSKSESSILVRLSDTGIQKAGATLMNYVDGFIAAVPTAKRADYLKHAEITSAIFKEHGALSIVECWGDDVPEGETTSFTKAVLRKPDETVVFSWIAWPSRNARDEGMKKAMADSRLQNIQMPFDGQRMIFGGFEVMFNV